MSDNQTTTDTLPPPIRARKTVEERRQAELKKISQAKARLAAIDARANLKSRRLETRRHFILGDVMLALAETDPEASGLVSALIARITRPQDKLLFGDFKVPAPPAPKDLRLDAEGQSSSKLARLRRRQKQNAHRLARKAGGQ